MNNNQWDGQQDISRFLEKFNPDLSTQETDIPAISLTEPNAACVSQQQLYNQSFEKLETKIRELEDKFIVSSAQNQAVMQELARTRQVIADQKSKDAALARITATVAHLKESVARLSSLAQTQPVYDTAAFETTAPVVPSTDSDYFSFYKPDYARAELAARLRTARQETQQARAALQAIRTEKENAETALKKIREENNKILHTWHQEREKQKRELVAIEQEHTEKTRIISTLQQKASQLKAVNIALDREIKQVHQERVEALRKSAEQAKEILFLRDELNATEERVKSFDFEGRILSIKQQFEQKINTLETQLHEISATCMKQMEEMEALKVENTRLHKIIREKEELAALYEAQTRELEALKISETKLREEADREPARLAAFTQRIQRLQAEQATLEERLETTQHLLQSATDEKQVLDENFHTLLTKVQQSDSVIESLKEKIATLTQENQTLKKNQAPKPPVPPTQVREPVAVRQPVLASAPRFAAKAQEELSGQTATAPVEVQYPIRPKVRTEADLPEIRVAHIPQEELYNGEDFLERTDSFIGRMKWSIFRDEK